MAVQAMLQDRTGFLWIGTQNGLFRYDGKSFTHFGKKDGLPGEYVNCLFQDSTGAIWAGIFTAGASKFENGRFTSQGYEFGDIAYQGITEDSERTLYFATENGLKVGKEKHFRTFTEAEGLPSRQVTSVYYDSEEGVWIGSGNRVALLKDGKIAVLDSSLGIPNSRIDAILKGLDGTLYIRTPNQLFRRKKGTQRFEPFMPPWSLTNAFGRLYQDSHGALWIPTNIGLTGFDASGWHLFDSRKGLPSDSIYTVLEDHEGGFWIGSSGAGLIRWLGRGVWTGYKKTEGLSSDVVWTIQRDRQSKLWVGTDVGLDWFDPISNSWKNVKIHEIFGSRHRTMALAPDGKIWLGVEQMGLVQFDPLSGNLTCYATLDGRPLLLPRSLVFDRDGKIWVGTFDGLYCGKRHGSRFEFKNIVVPINGSPHEAFGSLILDRRGVLWAAGRNGLVSFDGNQWKRYTKREGLMDDNTTYLSQDLEGNLWVSYRLGFGVTRLEFSPTGIKSRSFAKGNGLATNRVYSLGVDHQGRVWVGTDLGMDLINPATYEIQHLSRADGMIWDDVDSSAFFVDMDGSVWIGTSGGLSHFNPANYVPCQTPPKAIIVSADLGRRRVYAGQTPPPAMADDSLQIHFAGLTFYDEGKVHFFYQLKGIDHQPIETNHNEVRYPNLQEGKYTFEVTCRNAAGILSQEPARLSFLVRPPWWRSKGAYLIGIGGLLGVVWWALKWRTRALEQARKKLAEVVAVRTGELLKEKELITQKNLEIEGLLGKAQESTRMKTQFLANMSHEIRTPMNGIIGMTDLLGETALSPEQHEYILTIKQSGKALLGVINDILDVSKVEAGKLELENIPFNLQDVVEDIAGLLAEQAHAKGLDFACFLDPDVPLNLMGDPGRLRQIITNLLSNSIKFTEKGEVLLQVELKEIQPARVVIRVNIADTGIGIPVEKQNRIFQAFAQADGSTTRRYGGTGLGLTISRQLVELMKGEIGVTSEPGRGSTFWFTVCFGVQAEAELRPVTQEVESLKGTRILVLDDHSLTRDFIVRMLQSHSIKAEGVSDPAHVMTALSTSHSAGDPFRVILFDADLAWGDGLALAREIKSIPAFSTIRMVLLTAFGQRGDGEKCREAMIDGYLTKPVRSGDLLAIIQGVLQSTPSPQAVSPLITRHSIRESSGKVYSPEVGTRVLLVEDNLVNQKLALRLMEKRGFEVALAGNGQEALDLLAKETFDFALMDIQMPLLDGLETTRQIRILEKESNRHLPIIAMTAHAMKGDRERCLEAGMDHYVTKPIQQGELFAVIARVLNWTSLRDH
jgi:signal transduction histidine kinase/ligand-binding sensor domain-containing protein/DNA-binding response OmpR family regulator